MDSVNQAEKIIQDFWESAPSNSLHLETGEKAWEKPHIAIARGDDPLFLRHKEQIGSFLWTPEEAYALAFPNSPTPACELQVISYVLPQTAKTRADQRQEKTLPSERWARSRFHGEEFNCDLRLHLAETLTKAGYPSVAPERLPDFDYQQSERFGLASNWSERHVAFVAGHGTFSLSDAMITRWGKAVRFGSVVSRIDLPITERVYGEDHHAWASGMPREPAVPAPSAAQMTPSPQKRGTTNRSVLNIFGGQQRPMPLKPMALVLRHAVCAKLKSLANPKCPLHYSDIINCRRSLPKLIVKHDI